MGRLPSKIRNLVHKATPFIERIRRRVKIYITVIVVGAVVVPVIFYSVGFTPAIALGSLAAAWHASIGNVIAGSAFAILQSLGAAPWLLAVVGGATGAFGCFIHSLWKNMWDEDSSEKA